jgi:hypothetical protein
VVVLPVVVEPLPPALVDAVVEVESVVEAALPPAAVAVAPVVSVPPAPVAAVLPVVVLAAESLPELSS